MSDRYGRRGDAHTQTGELPRELLRIPRGKGLRPKIKRHTCTAAGREVPVASYESKILSPW